MVESFMILPALFECGNKVCGINRHHLVRRRMLADPWEVDERSDPTPRETGKALDRFFVMVDAVVPGRLRRIDVGQLEARRKADDSLRGPVGHDRSPKEVALSVSS
jgi:hypothetical protein